GESPDTGQEPSVQAYADDVLAVADAVGFVRFVTVAHSMGAKYAQYLRIVAPDRLLGQVAITPSPASAEGDVDEDLIEAMAGMAADRAAIHERLRGISSTPMSDEVLESLVDAAAPVSRDVLASSYRCFAMSDFEEELASCPAPPPTLVIAGAADPFYPPAFI